MGSDDIDPTPPHSVESGMRSQPQHSRGGGSADNANPLMWKPRTVAPPDFIISNGARFFLGHGSPCVYGADSQAGKEHHVGSGQSHGRGSSGTHSGDESDSGQDDDNDDEEEDDVDNGDGEVEGMMQNGSTKNLNNSSGSMQSSCEKDCQGKVKSQEHQSSFVPCRGGQMKEGCNNNQRVVIEHHHQLAQEHHFEHAVDVSDPRMFCSRILPGEDIALHAQREKGGGFSGRKGGSSSADYMELLRMHLSDPVTGALMDDAMILTCGHSFGSVGLQHVNRMKACFKCGNPVSENLLRPNLALRSAVHAFHREEETQLSKSSKRRRDRSEQDKCNNDDSLAMDILRGKGVQFPFAVSDKVIIKGNKRTPERFVGRIAVVTTQCLNGWYVVKTLDNAESVKLQYRSLSKVADESPSLV